MVESTYQHTQRAPLCVLLYVLALAFLATAYSMQNEPVLMWSFALASLSILVLATAFHHLTVEDGGNCLVIRFGPLPLFKRRVPYEWIVSVEPGKTTLLDGLGIHWSFQGGWTWILWGNDCVILRLRNGILRIGSNDVPRLSAFLRSRISGNSVFPTERH